MVAIKLFDENGVMVLAKETALREIAEAGLLDYKGKFYAYRGLKRAGKGPKVFLAFYEVSGPVKINDDEGELK